MFYSVRVLQSVEIQNESKTIQPETLERFLACRSGSKISETYRQMHPQATSGDRIPDIPKIST